MRPDPTERSQTAPLWNRTVQENLMKNNSDKIRAKQLLETRQHGYKILPFFRLRARRYTFYSLLFAVILFLLAVNGFWFAFGSVFSFLLGLLFVYVRWLRGQRNVWPFAVKIINWDVVKKISEDESSV
jgi:hypothetical protein